MCVLQAQSFGLVCCTCPAQILALSDNQIGDAGVTAMTNACVGGALANLQTLLLGSILGGNNIGDEGMKALADALSRGALASLKRLDLECNHIGDAGITALASACAKGALAQLTKLYLSYNQIGDVGLTSLAEFCAKGALPKCSKNVDLYGNPASEEAQQAVKDTLASRS